MVLRSLFFLIIFFCFCCESFTQQLAYTDESLDVILKDIEQKTNRTFNYDTKRLAEYRFSGKLNLTDIDKAVEQLFYDSPFEFEHTNERILVILPPPDTLQLCGYIKSKLDQAPLPYANVSAEGTSIGTSTNENGYFEFTISAHKNQRINISYIGYHPKMIRFDQWQKKNCPTFILEENLALFDGEITIIDYIVRGITEGENYSSIGMDYSKVCKDYRINERDVFKNIQLLPGISSIDESATSLSIRGASPDHNLLLWENATLYDPGHMFGMISSVNPFTVKKINIYKGVFDPKYDNRIGGIVDISLSDEVSKSVEGSFGSTFTEAHGYLDIPVIQDKLSVLFSGRHTIAGLFESPTLISYSDKIFQPTAIEEGNEDDGEREEAESEEEIEYYDYNVKVLGKPSESLLLKASYFKSFNRFDYTALLLEDNISTNENLTFNTEAFSSEIQQQWNKQFSTRAFFIRSFYSNENISDFSNEDDEDDFSNTSIYNDIKDRQIGLSNRWSNNTGLTIDIGYTYDQKTVNYNIEDRSRFEEDFSESEIVDGNFHNIHGAINWQNKKLSLNAGLRNTYYLETEEWTSSPRLNVQYLAKPYLKFKASAGRLYQYISQVNTFEENGLVINNKIWVLNDIFDTSVLNALKLSTGFIISHKAWLFDVEVYQNKVKGLPALTTQLTNTAEDNDEGNSTSIGLDLLLKKNWKNYNCWVNYSLSENIYSFPTLFNEAFPSNQDHRHNFSLVNQWVKGKWTATVTYQYRSGLPFSTPDGIYSYFDDDDELFYELNFEKINNLRLKDYHRLDVGISYLTTIAKDKLNAEINISLLNLFNRENIFARHYFLGEIEEESEGPEIFAIDRALLRITPQFLFRIYW